MTRSARTYRFVGLGCAKNQVDGEVMQGLLDRAGWVPVDDPDLAELIVINTCTFIEPAREESVEVILEEARRKRTGRCRTLVVTGCLPQMYGGELVKELPEVDLFVGTGEYHRIAELLADNEREPRCIVAPPRYIADADAPRRFDGPSVYVKVAEGCSNDCAYCVIGRVRGPFRSRPVDDVLAEIDRVTAAGAKEICLISQDTTRYGTDLTPPSDLPGLLEQVAERAGGAWIRLLYLHPARVTDRLLEVLAGNNTVCRYLDIPIQHASDRVLKAMGRPTTRAVLTDLVERARRIVPGLSLRTTVLVGHPGEDDAAYDELLQFVEWARFDHLGAFVYSPEEGTRSASLGGAVPVDAAEERRHRLMELQAAIGETALARHVGSVLPVLVERPSGEHRGHFEGRTEFQAPDVDGITLVAADGLETGDRIDVLIEDNTCYDLAGSPDRKTGGGPL